jgi:serine/threonine protein kinase/tetratricopeptide (TPR) repeat protein
LTGDAATTSVEVKCPVCGQIGKVRDPDDPKVAPLSESETLPPHPAAVPEAIAETHLPQMEPAQAKNSSGTRESYDDARKSHDFRYGATNPPTIPGFEILEPLGEGGMGQVYKARQVRLDRIVALKVIHPDYLSNPDAVRRFHREARAAARMAHPHLVTVYDVDEVCGTHFLVMEFVDGSDLGRLVKSQGVLPGAQACEYVRQAALGLQHIHERGLVHRDIKPTNLFLTSNGTLIKVLDLGLARLNQSGPSDQVSAELTQPGAVMGTPAFLAPEQARDSRRVDIRSDIYSLGCTFYYLLTGRVPFPGIGLAEIVVQHQLDEPEPVEKMRPDVPNGVISVVRKMMAKKPEDRYQTPAEVAGGLTPFCHPMALASTGTAPEADRIAGRINPPVSANLFTGVMTDPARPAKIDQSRSTPTELLDFDDARSPSTSEKQRKWRLRPILVFCGFLLVLGPLVFVGGAWVFHGCTPEVVFNEKNLPRTARMPNARDYQQAEEHNNRALARNPREYDAAIADLTEAIQLVQDKPEYFANRGRRYILRGQENSTPEDYDKAVADFTEAIRLAPKMGDYWNQRGWAYLNKDDWQKALADIDVAVGLMPRAAACYSNRGWAYKIKGDYAAALLDFNKAIELDQRHAPAIQLRGEIYLKQRKYSEAKQDFHLAIDIDPTNASAYHGSGQAYLKAIEANRVLPGNPERFQLLNNALADLNQAISLRPNYAPSYLVRSEIYALLGENGKSRADHAEAIRRDPSLAKEKK